ncbi:MAG: hypothetical protein K2I62_04670 [Alistipes sp.]|nr:hypothetical protein [Alistipes sp.]
MKKTIIILWAATGCIGAASAQDLIVRRDSSRIEARVTEISPTEIRYKRASNPDGPTYVLPLATVSAIRYANGEEETFAPASTTASQTEQAPAAAPQTLAPPTGNAPAADIPAGPRRVGDYYDRDDVQGIVCYVDATGEHGLILSLDEAMLPWSLFRKPDLRALGTVHPSDGRENMAAAERYLAKNGLSWDVLPAFKWCRDHGDGWYLPSIDEMLAIGHSYHGGSRTHSDRRARNSFNEALRVHGGKRMDRMLYYFTSTEKDEKEALSTHMDLQPPYLVEIPKYNKFPVRAVHRF